MPSKRNTATAAKPQSDKDLKGFIAHFITSGSVDVINDWLKTYARGRWTIRAEGMDDDINAMKYELRFMDKSDYNNFRARFTRPKQS